MNESGSLENEVRIMRGEFTQLSQQFREERASFITAMQEERASWQSIGKELADIGGSLRILLDDRKTLQETLQRTFSRIEVMDKAISDLSTRIGVAEAHNAAVSVAQGNTSSKLWSVVSLIIGAIIIVVANKVMGK